MEGSSVEPFSAAGDVSDAPALKSREISSAYSGAIEFDDVFISKPYFSRRWLMKSINSLLETLSSFANAWILMLICFESVFVFRVAVELSRFV